MAEFSNKASLTVKKEDREYCLTCPSNANLGEVYDSLNEIIAWVVARIQEAQKNSEKKPEETPKEENHAAV